MAALHPGLHSGSRFRAVPGTAHALEPGKGPIEGGRPGAIAQAVWKLGPKGRRLWRSGVAIRLGGLASRRKLLRYEVPAKPASDGLARHTKGAPPNLKAVGLIEQGPATLVWDELVVGLRVGTHTLRFGGQQFLVAARFCLAESQHFRPSMSR